MRKLKQQATKIFGPDHFLAKVILGEIEQGDCYEFLCPVLAIYKASSTPEEYRQAVALLHDWFVRSGLQWLEWFDLEIAGHRRISANEIEHCLLPFVAVLREIDPEASLPLTVELNSFLSQAAREVLGDAYADFLDEVAELGLSLVRSRVAA